ERQVLLRKDRGGTRQAPRNSRGAGSAAEGLSPDDRRLFDRLRALRTELAKAADVPSYVVFPDATLAGIAAARPRNERALLAISGVGASKLERYGAVFLEAVAAFEAEET